jgi:hypothetical protein
MISWMIINGSLFVVIGLIVVSAAAIVIGFKHLVRCVSCRRKDFLFICLIVLISWVIRQFLITHMHNVYFDEFFHMQLARNLLHTGHYGLASVAGDPESPVIFPVKWPPAFHVFLAGAYSVLGTNENSAFALNALFGTLGVFSTWLYVRMLSFSPAVSLLTASVVALWPLHLRLSAGVSLEPGSMAFVLIAAALTLAYFETRSRAVFWAASAAVGLAGMFRLESAAAAVMVPILIAIMEKKKGVVPFRLKSGQYPILIGLWLPMLLFAMSGFHEYQLIRQQNDHIPFWGSLSFWFGGGLMPFSYTALMVTGLLYLVKKRKSLSIAFSLAILAMLAIYTFYVHVDASLGDLQRYQLQCAPGFLGLAAAAFQWSDDLKKKRHSIQIIVILLVVAGLITSLPMAQEPFQERHEQKYRFLISLSHRLSKTAVYFAAAPPMLSTTLNVRCYPLQKLLENPVDIPDGRNRTKIYFRDLWSSTQNHTDETIRDRYALRPIAEQIAPLDSIGFYEVSEKPAVDEEEKSKPRAFTDYPGKTEDGTMQSPTPKVCFFSRVFSQQAAGRRVK